MECGHVKGFKHMLLNACNEDNNPVVIGLPESPRRLNATHTIHLYVEEYNIKILSRRKQPFPRGKTAYIKIRIPLFYETTNLLSDGFLIIDYCYIQNSSPRISVSAVT
jgi:hypothetical protein